MTLSRRTALTAPGIQATAAELGAPVAGTSGLEDRARVAVLRKALAGTLGTERGWRLTRTRYGALPAGRLRSRRPDDPASPMALADRTMLILFEPARGAVPRQSFRVIDGGRP